MKTIKKELDGLLQKDMDRLTFIKHVGIGFGAIIGVSSVIKTMNGFGSSTADQGLSQGTAMRGYGYSSYGAERETSRQAV